MISWHPPTTAVPSRTIGIVHVAPMSLGSRGVTHNLSTHILNFSIPTHRGGRQTKLPHGVSRNVRVNGRRHPRFVGGTYSTLLMRNVLSYAHDFFLFRCSVCLPCRFSTDLGFVRWVPPTSPSLVVKNGTPSSTALSTAQQSAAASAAL